MAKSNQARVNGGSNYDSLKVAKCLVIIRTKGGGGGAFFSPPLATLKVINDKSEYMHMCIW